MGSPYMNIMESCFSILAQSSLNRTSSEIETTLRDKPDLSIFKHNDPRQPLPMPKIPFNLEFNYGKSEHSSHRIPGVRTLLMCFYGLFTISGATFNLILIFALLKFRKQTLSHNITNLFVLCLAVSDIFLCSVSMPIQVVYEIYEHHRANTSLCRVLFSSFGIPMYISCLTILLIAFDRYRLIVYPLKWQLSPQAAIGLISFVVMFSILNSIPVALQVDNVQISDFHYCVESWPTPQLRFAYSVSIFLVLMLLPLCASGAFYWAIYRRLNQRPSQLGIRKEAERRKKRTTSLLVITVVCFAVCWTPWCLYSLLLEVETLMKVDDGGAMQNTFITDLAKSNEAWQSSNFVKQCEELLFRPLRPNNITSVSFIPGKHIKLIDLLLKLFAMGSACVNPFLYGWLNEPIRQVMKRQSGRIVDFFRQLTRNQIGNKQPNHISRCCCIKSASFCKSQSEFENRAKLVVEPPSLMNRSSVVDFVKRHTTNPSDVDLNFLNEQNGQCDINVINDLNHGCEPTRVQRGQDLIISSKISILGDSTSTFNYSKGCTSK